MTSCCRPIARTGTMPLTCPPRSGSTSTARCRRCGGSRSARTTCSCASSSRARATSRSAWRRSPLASAPPCEAATTPSPPTAGHAHTLARGVPMTPVLAELLGRANGLMGGKGGSMHLTSVEHGMLGSYAIIGAHLTIANGAAWSAQYRGSGQVAACFFGDGTTNIGAFHEALNYAVVWRLPVVYGCENNLYM